MNNFICPVCKSEFTKNNNSYICRNNHCFDISKKGTVNLLRSNKSSHGDDKLMVNARRSFLDKGYYLPLLEVLKKQLCSAAQNKCTILENLSYASPSKATGKKSASCAASNI